MTATKTPRPDEHEQGGELPVLPWTARMLDDTTFSKASRHRNAGYTPAEVDAFKKRAVARVAQLETDYAKVYEQLRAHQEAAKARHNPARPPVMAVAAVADAQAQAEADLARARHEFSEVRRRTADMWAQAEAALRRAQADGNVPPEPDLPEPPTTPNDDPVAALQARHEHLQAVSTALDEWEARMQEYVTERMAKLAEGRGALAEQTEGFVHLLDEIAEAVPTMRAQLVAVETEDDESDVTEVVETEDVPA